MSLKNNRHNVFSKFLWYSSGSTIRELSLLSKTGSDFFGIGGVNVFISVLTLFLSAWSFHFAFQKVSIPFYILFGLTMSIIVFSLNRQTIIAFSNYNSVDKNIRFSFTLMPILLFSIFFGLVLSTPLKFYLFDIPVNSNIIERLNFLQEISDSNISTKVSSWSLTVIVVIIFLLPTLIKSYTIRGSNHKKRSSLLNEFMWFCSGANKEVLIKCPNEYAKYFGIGGTILFTALMATLSGGYAFYTAFQNPSTAIVFGLFWGAMIFNLDRFIVNTMYSDGMHTISKQELLGGMPRLIIAIFLGIVISYPLELKLFEDEINVSIEKLKVENIQGYNRTIEESFSQIGINNTEIKEIELKREKLQNEINEARERFESIKKVQRIGTRIDEEGNRISYTYYVWPEQYYTYKKTYEETRERNEIDIEDYRNKIKTIEAKISSDEALKSGYQKSHNVQNVALNDLSTRMEAFGKLKDDKPAIKTASAFIMLLLIIIEIAPVLFKMMMTSGDYEVIQNAERNNIKVAEIVRMSEKNDWANAEIAKIIDENKKRILEKQNELSIELNSNQELLKSISKAQSEIAQVAINKWKKQELKRAVERPESFIQTNNN